MTSYKPDQFLERYSRRAGPILFLLALALV